MKTEIKVQTGAIFVNHALIDDNTELKLVHVDLKSKRAEVFGFFGGEGDEIPEIHLKANSETLHFDETNPQALTTIFFPEFKGWDIHTAEIGRYTLYVVFKREKNNAS